MMKLFTTFWDLKKIFSYFRIRFFRMWSLRRWSFYQIRIGRIALDRQHWDLQRTIQRLDPYLRRIPHYLAIRRHCSSMRHQQNVRKHSNCFQLKTICNKNLFQFKTQCFEHKLTSVHGFHLRQVPQNNNKNKNLHKIIISESETKFATKKGLR